MSPEPNACDEWGNPISLSVANGFPQSSEIVRLSAEIADLKAQIRNRDDRIVELVEQGLSQHRRIVALESESSDKSARIEELEAERERLPLGLIIPPAAYLGAIPEGWKICDGSNGTPDLRSLKENDRWPIMKVEEKK